MRIRKQATDRMRKSPTQERSQETVNIIFEAAARILERDGREGFNTNAVAELAGISIGTLYHYFPSKDAILIEMARRELRAHASAMKQTLADSLAVSLDPRSLVKALIHASGQRLRARQIAMDTLITHGLGKELAMPVQAIAELLQDGRVLTVAGSTERIPSASLFVLTRAVSGVLNAIVREDLPTLAGAELEDELVRLVVAYLSARRISFALQVPVQVSETSVS